MYNEKIVTVVPVRSVNEYLALNGIPQSGTFIEFKETSGTAELAHSATENSDGSVTHDFSIEIAQEVVMSNKTYINFEIISERSLASVFLPCRIPSWYPFCGLYSSICFLPTPWEPEVLFVS